MHTALTKQAPGNTPVDPHQEISLRPLTLVQYLFHPETYKEYEEGITCFLRTKGLAFTPLPEYYFTPEDEIYDLVLAYQLRDHALLKIGPFLCYQQHKYFGDKLEAFSRFVELTLRQHAELIPDACTLTVKEWLTEQKGQLENQSGRSPTNLKGRPQREAGDKQTALNQELTALFIHYLQRGQIIFSGEYLNNKQAGDAFHILTGYSAETMRQSLNAAEIERIATKKNLTTLYNALARLSIFIDRDLKNNVWQPF